MSNPRISVIIPAYNSAKWINEAINSVLAQSFTDLEIIVVDDGSSDDTEQVLTHWIAARQIRYIKQANMGVSAARNCGVREACGDYIAFLDADDLFAPDKLGKQLALFEKQPNLGFVHAHFSKFDEAGNDLGLRDMSRFSGWVYPQILLEWSAIMALPTLMLPKRVFEEVGGFDESVRWGEDIDLYIRIVRRYPIDLVPEVLCKVRVHADSVSASKLGSAASFQRVLQKALDADDSLSPAFGRRAFSQLYINKAQNLLGEGGSAEMQIARGYAATALRYTSLSPAAWLTALASWIPAGLRRFFVKALRRIRYKQA